MSLVSSPLSSPPSTPSSSLQLSPDQHDVAFKLEQEEGEARERTPNSTGLGEKIAEGTKYSSSLPPYRYYLQKLREFAPLFWGRIDSADCTIILEVGQDFVPYELHTGYVAYQSPVLYNAFMGRFNPAVTPLDRSSYSTPLPSPPPSPNVPPSPLGALRDLEFDRPTVHVSLPDPASFDLILHFLYWGDASVVEEALDEGAYSCEGLIDNVRVLDIGTPLKVVVGKWWMRNAASKDCTSTSPRRTRLQTSPFSESDSEYGDSKN